MRRRVVGAAVVLALIGGSVAAWWWHRRGQGAATAPPAEESAASLIARKRAARRSPTADQTPGGVSGVVTDRASQKGIAGATVSVARHDLEGQMQGAGSSGTVRPLVFVTDGAGRWTADDVAPGAYLISANATGYLPGAHDAITLVAAERRRDLDLALDPGGSSLSGIVSDVSGGPVPAATVSVVSSDTLFDWARPTFSAQTGDDGRYRLSVRDGSYVLAVWQPDYAPTSRTITVRGATTVDLALMPGSTIQGRVVTRDGERPVPGALVSRPIAAVAKLQFTISGLGVAADAEGKFVLRGLPPGETRLSAAAPGFSSLEPTIVDLGIGDEVPDVVIRVAPARTVSGFAVGRGHHDRAVAGALIAAMSVAQRTMVFASRPSEKDGYFEIDGLRPGAYMVVAIGEDFVPNMMTQTFTLEDHDVDDLLVELASGTTLTGRVDPPAAASMVLEVQGAVGFGNMMNAVSAAMVHGQADGRTGEFTLRVVPDGDYKVVAKTEGGKKGAVDVTVADEHPQSGLLVRLEERASIAGVVSDFQGKPVAGLTIGAEKAGGKKQLSLAAAFHHEVTDADGRFRLQGIDPGDYVLKATDAWGDVPIFDRAKGDSRISIANARPVEGVTLTAIPGDQAIRGTVVDERGRGVRDVMIRPSREADPMSDGKSTEPKGLAPILTDDGGHFTIDHVRMGSYTLVAEGFEGGGRATETDVVPGEDVTLTLKALGTISGRVSRAGKPITDYSFTLEGPTDRLSRIAQAEGRFSERRLDPGDYVLRVRAEDGGAAARATISSGQSVTVDLELAPFGTLRGRLVDVRNGAPLAGMASRVSSQLIDDQAVKGALAGATTKTDGDGRFEVGRIGPGPGTLTFHTVGLLKTEQVGEKAFDMPPGQDLDLGTIRGLPPLPDAKDPGSFGVYMVGGTWQEVSQFFPDTEGPPTGDDPERQSLWVVLVASDSPAAKAGIKRLDRILAVDGLVVGDLPPNMLAYMIEPPHVSVGQTTKLTMDRGEVTLTAVPYTPPATP